MKKTLDFLIKVNRLKEMPRTGWVLMDVKDPETVAEHIWGVAIITWLLGEKKGLNVEKLIKIAFSHDLCEVYAGDTTPFFYYPRLPKDKKERNKMLMKWARLSSGEKQKIGKLKFKKENRALLKLIKLLNPRLGKEFCSYWLEYEKGILNEGKFVRQLNRVETLLQSIDYFGTKDIRTRTNWWEWVEEIVDDQLLITFLEVIQNRFYGKVVGYRKDKELEDILDTILKIEKLKHMPRLYWVMRGVKQPETVAGHIFTLTLMALVFGREVRPKLNMEKLLKMALCHEITAVFTGDTTPYDRILSKSKRERSEILKKWPRLSFPEKKKIFLADYNAERKALKRLTQKLKSPIKKEMIQLWKDYRNRSSPEGHFLSQLNVLAVLLQALLYTEKYKNFSAVPLWEWAFEISDNPINFRLMDEMKKRFYG